MENLPAGAEKAAGITSSIETMVVTTLSTQATPNVVGVLSCSENTQGR